MAIRIQTPGAAASTGAAIAAPIDQIVTSSAGQGVVTNTTLNQIVLIVTKKHIIAGRTVNHAHKKPHPAS
ncbi:MAG: hypothetical protein O3B72_12570 [Proteobacteria bacterium]|nr:hypothetical protein [Pseudomonadota bacterium]